MNHRPPPPSCRAVSWATVMLGFSMLLSSESARADVAPIKPTTRWAQNEAPSRVQAIIGGASISLAIALAGVVIMRWPKRASRGVRFCLLGLLLVALAGSIGATALVCHWVQRDEQQWSKYERELEWSAEARHRNKRLQWELEEQNRQKEIGQRRDQEELRRTPANATSDEVARVPAQAP